MAGWVANRIDPAFAELEDNLTTLTRRLDAPCLGRIPHLGDTAEAQRPEQAAEHLRLPG